MAETCDIGDVIRLSIAFTNTAGEAADPTTVTLTVRPPSGTLETYTYALAQVTKSAVGSYYKDVAPDEAGIWWYRYAGTGTVTAADEDYFYVRTQQTA